MASQEITAPVASTASSPVKKATEESKKEATRAAIGTTFQMRSEIPSIPSTLMIGFTQTGTDDKSAGNFDYTVSLLEKGTLGYFRRRDQIADDITHVELDMLAFSQSIARTLAGVLHRFLMKKTELPTDSLNTRVMSTAATLAAGCCVEAYLKVRDLVLSETPGQYTTNRIRRPRASDRLAIPRGFAFAIQQLGIVNVADLPTELICLPRFSDAGHTTGIPNHLLTYWGPHAYAQAVEYARDLGMQFSMIDLNKKDGTAWWLFRQDYEDGVFELKCPIPESNFTKSMLTAHAMFLNGDAADPSHPFVDLTPLGEESFGIMMRNPHLGINLSAYEAVSKDAPEVVANV